MIDKTLAYSDTSEKTQAYADDLGSITQSYPEQAQRPMSTIPKIAPEDTVIFNDKPYTITEIISQETGEAIIYKILDQQEQPLALKLYFNRDLHDEPNPEALQRIQRINDADILRLHDFGIGEQKYHGIYCFEICDFAEGGNLLVRAEYTPEFLRQTVVPQIFKGIRTLHDYKIYHCDLKPQNIFWLDVAQTDLVIGDYGSAKTFEETSEKQLTHTSVLKGTSFYLAPEQARGVVSAKNDYYAFGIILLQLLYPQYVNRGALHKIVERQFERKPIIDYDPQYGDLNTLIAGLTLVDVSARWGETQVLQWLRGEQIEISYTSDADIHPIKLGTTTIRTPTQLVQYIDQHAEWYESLIDDKIDYDTLLRWVQDVQDSSRRKTFDRMVKHYQQDGKKFVKEAIIHYFAPERPIRIDMHEYDFWNAPDLETTVTQFFQHLDESAQVTSIDKKRFYLFQLEFVLRQFEMDAESQAKKVARSLLDRLEAVLNLAPKAAFDDFGCHCYSHVSEENVMLLLYAFHQSKTINSALDSYHHESQEVGNDFEKADRLYHEMNDEHQKNQKSMQILKKKMPKSAPGSGEGKFAAVLRKVFFVSAYLITGFLWPWISWFSDGSFLTARDIELIKLYGVGSAFGWPALLAGDLIGILLREQWALRALLYLLLAIVLSLIPSGLIYQLIKAAKHSRERLYQKQCATLSKLNERNEEIRQLLSQKQQTYNNLKRKKNDIENKITHFQKEMERVQGL